MRTIVEIYGRQPVNNVLSAVLFRPEHVLFVCDRANRDLRLENAQRQYLKNNGIRGEIKFFETGFLNESQTWDLFTDLCARYPDIAFDLSGGTDFMLAVAGAFCREKKIPAFYFDLATGGLYWLFATRKEPEYPAIVPLMVKDCLQIAGASLERTDHYSPSMHDVQMQTDILKVCDIFFENRKNWADTVRFLQYAAKQIQDPDTLTAQVRIPARINERFVWAPVQVLEQLCKIGVIRQLEVKGNRVTLRYKNKVLKELLGIHGVWVELYTYLTAKRSHYFDDARMSVVIDWDGPLQDFEKTSNEVDTVLTKNAKTIFVSCKSGVPDKDALAEIKVLADRFGGSYGKAVMVTTCRLLSENPVIYKRAKEMGIAVIDLDDITSGQLCSQLIRVSQETYHYKR